VNNLELFDGNIQALTWRNEEDNGKVPEQQMVNSPKKGRIQNNN